MPTDAPSLLPPSATPLERALEQSMARIGDVPVPIEELWNTDTCPVEILPWLGWSLSIDRWEITWTEAQKRRAVASAIAMQRIKGTPASVKAVLATFDNLLEIVEWWQQSPRTAAHTFEVRLPMDGAGGARSTASFAEAVIAQVERVKPARSHFQLVQTLMTAGQIGLVSAARSATYLREDGIGTPDTSQPWTTFLQTEDGEPIQTEAGDFLLDVT
jgi:phage tail P2-like protein